MSDIYVFSGSILYGSEIPIDNQDINTDSSESYIGFANGSKPIISAPKLLINAYWIHFPPVVVTNILIICTIYFVRRLHNPHNIIIAGLAIMDLLTGLVTLPLAWLNDTSNRNGEYVLTGAENTCYFKHFTSFFFKRVALAFLFLMSLERFLAIKFPFKHQMYSSNNNTFIVLVCTFCIIVIEGIFSLSFPSEGNGWVDGLSRAENNLQCSVRKRLPKLYLGVVVHIITSSQIFISCFLTLWVGYIAWMQKRIQRRLTSHITTVEKANSQISTIRATTALNCIYVLLWLPYVATLIAISKKASKQVVVNGFAFNYNCVFMNAWVNGVVYAFSKQMYRKAYYHFFTNVPWKWSGINEVLKTSEAAYTMQEQSSRYQSKRNPNASIDSLKFLDSNEEVPKRPVKISFEPPISQTKSQTSRVSHSTTTTVHTQKTNNTKKVDVSSSALPLVNFK